MTIPEGNAALAALGYRAATDERIADIAQMVLDRAAHDHPARGKDLYCLNLTSWMGERMGPVLVRLRDAEAERNTALAEVERLLRPEDVERLLKRERDTYEARDQHWNVVDDVLDTFRLHLATGTPLTSPRPTEGPEDPFVGAEPLTEAEQLRAEVERLRDAETDRDRLRHALERAAQAVAHDYDSAACRERPAYQERLKPCQQRPPEHDEDCPACDLQTALDPAPDDCGCDRHDVSTPEATP